MRQCVYRSPKQTIKLQSINFVRADYATQSQTWFSLDDLHFMDKRFDMVVSLTLMVQFYPLIYYCGCGMGRGHR